MPRQVLICLVLITLLSPVSSWASNPNESVGFPTGSMMIGGPGGDSISAFNGDLELSYPIGPTWELPGMSWGLTLRYSSKVWRVQDGTPNDGTLSRRGPFGVGWLMTMGRIFEPCRQGCQPGGLQYAFEDATGTVHPIKFTSTSGGVQHGMTTDGTFIRAEKTLLTGQYRLFPGNGVVMFFDDDSRFGDTHSIADNMSDDFTGRLLSRMEKRGPDPNVVLSWVEVDYDSDPNYPHCISEIRDGLGTGTTPLRTITFLNKSVKQRAAGGSAQYHGGYTTEITMPGVLGQDPNKVVYRFEYEPLRDLTSADPNQQGAHSDQLLLSSIDVAVDPDDPNDSGLYSHDFSYDQGTGEMTARTLPTGGTISYEYENHTYAMTGPVFVSLRRVKTKCIGLCSDQNNPNRWTYSRVSAGTSYSIIHSTITDPFGNETRYFFIDPYEPGAESWMLGLTELVESYTGAPWATASGEPHDTVRVSYEYGQFTFDGIDDIRTTKVTTNYPKEMTVEYSGALRYGHFTNTYEYGPTGSITNYDRKTVTVYDEPQEGENRWHNWVTSALESVTVKGPAPSSDCVRYIENTFLDDGKVDTQIKSDSCGSIGSGSIHSKNRYDPNNNGQLSDTIVWTGGASGPAVGQVYQTSYEYDDNGIYVVRTYTRDHQDPNNDPEVLGPSIGWYSLDVERDPLTGAVLQSMSPDGVITSIEYDILGRATKTTVGDPNQPPVETPLETIYVSLNETITRRGPSTGDRIESTSYYDELGRLVATTRVADASTEVIKSSCYDILGRPTFVSEWRALSGQEDPSDPGCTSPSYDGTSIDYTFLQNDVTVTDAKGRPHLITTADGAQRRFSYTGLDYSATASNLNNTPSSGQGPQVQTHFSRNWRGELGFVDSPVGADARYTYTPMGEIELVELLEDPPFGLPFIQTRSFEYDLLGRLATASEPETGIVQYTSYDAAGNLLQKVESDGTRLNMSYDPVGRLLTLKSERPDPDSNTGEYLPEVLLAEYSYDTLTKNSLRWVKSYDERGVFVAQKTYVYDGLNGRMSQEITEYPLWDGLEGKGVNDPSFRTCYEYNSLGLLESLRYPADISCVASSSDVATLDYLYSYGHLTALNDSRREASPNPLDPDTWELIRNIEYNNAGGLYKLTYANDVVTEITSDALYRPSQIQVEFRGQGQDIMHMDTGTYKYDGLGNIIEMGSDSFQYDGIGRLLAADVYHDGTRNRQTYSYDDFGGMTEKFDYDPNDVPTNMLSMNVSPVTNRIESALGTSYLYDSRGNLERDDQQAYLFDSRNRLLAVKGNESAWQTENYVYDASGMRIMVQEPATGRRTFFIRDSSGNILSEFTTSGAGPLGGDWQRDYFYALGRIIGHAQEERPRPATGLVSWTQEFQGDVTVHLSWTAHDDPNLSGYLVYRKDPNSGLGWENQTLTPVPSEYTTWTDPDTFPSSGVRFYRVAAITPGSESVTTRGLRIDPGGSLTNPDPNGFDISVRERSVSLRWETLPEDSGGMTPEPSTPFVGYNLYRRDDPNTSTWTLLTPLPLREAWFDDLGVEEGTSYTYMLRGVSSSGSETAAAVSSPVLPLGLPAAPTGLKAFSTGAARQIALRWNPNTESDLLWYHVYHKEGGNDVQVATVYPPLTEVTLSEYAEGQNHIFSVSAVDSAGESPFSASATARPRVPWPQAPQITSLQTKMLMAWEGASVEITYSLPTAQLYDLDYFYVYRKHIALPEDQWELVYSDKVVHHLPEDPNDPPPAPTYSGRYVDLQPYRCAVTEYVVTAKTIPDPGEQAELVEDSDRLRTDTFVHPRAPIIDFLPGQGQNPDVLRISADGLVYCAEAGNGWEIEEWKLSVYHDPNNPVDKHTLTIDPSQGWVDDPNIPSTGEVWSYVLEANVLSLYEMTDPNDVEYLDTFTSEDICIDEFGSIVTSDTACYDADGSQQIAPPPSCYPDCGNPGTGPNPYVVFGNPGPGDDPESRAADIMRMEAILKGRNTRLRVPSLLERDGIMILAMHSETAAGGATHSAACSLAHLPPNVVSPTTNTSHTIRHFGTLLTKPSKVTLSGNARGTVLLDNSRSADDLWPKPTINPGSDITLSQRCVGVSAGGLNVVPMLILGGASKSFTWAFYGLDHLGSIRVVSDESGSMLQKTTYMPYGQSQSTGTVLSSQRYGYTAHEVQSGASNLYYMRTRYMAHSRSNFISPDPLDVGQLSSDYKSQVQYMIPLLTTPTRFNRYAYAWSNPVRFIDPSGMSPIDDFFTNVDVALKHLQQWNWHVWLRRNILLASTPGQVIVRGGLIYWGCKRNPFACGLTTAGTEYTGFNNLAKLNEIVTRLMLEEAVTRSAIAFTEAARDAGKQGHWDLAQRSLESARMFLHRLSRSSYSDYSLIENSINKAIIAAHEAAEEQRTTNDRNPADHVIGNGQLFPRLGDPRGTTVAPGICYLCGASSHVRR